MAEMLGGWDDHEGVMVALVRGAHRAAAGGPVVMNFNMNNTELARNAAVSKLQDHPFSYDGAYVMNRTVTPADTVRSRPIITFTNNSSSTALVEYAIHMV